MQRKLITTADGSHSLYVEGLDENYHSKHGAIQESLHVFIKMGLHHLTEKGMKEISILEIGLGTGLNALLTWIEAEKLDINIRYTGLEAYPLEQEITDSLNYRELLTNNAPSGSAQSDAHDEVNEKYGAIHSSEWEKEIKLPGNFVLHKIKESLQEVKLTGKYDLIYFDAFGPRVQPEMWTDEIFAKIFALTNLGGVLVTYCSKGEVQRCMKRAGFTVEKVPGPPGKREMVRAIRL
ncbi:MAG: tRNA (5-methylaminomethyl-2-thiouridine)(34)-methyltransferase MnmD [Bacteroidia bacterium]